MIPSSRKRVVSSTSPAAKRQVLVDGKPVQIAAPDNYTANTAQGRLGNYTTVLQSNRDLLDRINAMQDASVKAFKDDCDNNAPPTPATTDPMPERIHFSICDVEEWLESNTSADWDTTRALWSLYLALESWLR